MFQVFFITFAACLVLFLALDILAARAKAKLDDEKEAKPRGTSILTGVVVSFIVAAVVAWGTMMYAHYAG